MSVPSVWGEGLRFTASRASSIARSSRGSVTASAPSWRARATRRLVAVRCFAGSSASAAGGERDHEQGPDAADERPSAAGCAGARSSRSRSLSSRLASTNSLSTGSSSPYDRPPSRARRRAARHGRGRPGRARRRPIRVAAARDMGSSRRDSRLLLEPLAHARPLAEQRLVRHLDCAVVGGQEARLDEHAKDRSHFRPPADELSPLADAVAPRRPPHRRRDGA